MNSFNGKTCIITGAGSGIGASLALSLIKKGANVIAAVRNPEKLSDQLKASLNVTPVRLDVRSKENWKIVLEEIENQSIKIDYLFLNAGICEYIDLPDFDSEKIKSNMDTNFMGIVYGVETFLPHFRKNNSGHFVGITSSVALLELPRAEGYGSSKSAATYLLRSLRLDLSKENIDISIVLPGFVDTKLTQKNDFDMPFIMDSNKSAERILKGVSKKKFEIHFPYRFTLILYMISKLPSFFRYKICRRFARA